MIWLTLLLPVAGIAWGIWHGRGRNELDNIGGVFAIVFGIVGFIFLICFIPITALNNGAKLAELQAFYNANTLNYLLTVDETAAYLSEDEFIDGLMIEGSIEKAQLTTAISERVAEWRDAVNEYNITIASMQYYDNNIFTGALYPDGIQDMKLLIIE